MSPAAQHYPRVAFFGAAGAFTAIPFAALLHAGVPIASLVVARDALGSDAPFTRLGPGRSLPILSFPLPLAGSDDLPNAIANAQAHGINVISVSDLSHPDFAAALAAAEPEILCVACFPRRLPAAILTIPRLGAVNLHPSMLPRNRGPMPLFWTFRLGEETTGVTLHGVDPNLDSGPILAQQELPVEDGVSYRTLERRCAETGAALLLELLAQLAAGPVIARPQEAAIATYHPWPREQDYAIPTTAPARWAYRFIRGVGELRPLAIVAGEQRLPIAAALGYDPRATQEPPVRRAGDEASVRFTPGVLRVRLRR